MDDDAPEAEEDEPEGAEEKPRRTALYLGIGLLSVLVFLGLFWYFQTEGEVPLLTEETPPDTVTSEMPGQEDAAMVAPPITPGEMAFQDAPPSPAAPEAATTPQPSPTGFASAKEPLTFVKTLKDEKATVPLSPTPKSTVKSKRKQGRSKTVPTSWRYTIQVGSFSQEAHATALSERLHKQGFDAYLLKSNVQNQGTRWRVRVGRFASRIEARAVAERLQGKAHLSFFIATTED